MATFIITPKLTKDEAIEAMRGIEKWFRDNPKRKVCRTDTFIVNRSNFVEEILKHTSL